MNPRFHERVRSLMASREALLRMWGFRVTLIGGIAALILIIGSLIFSFLFGPPGAGTPRNEFIVRPNDSLFSISQELQSEGLIRSSGAFRLAYVLTRGSETIRPGGYELTDGMDALSIAKKLGEAPYLAWVSIPAGQRKEETGEYLAELLGWTPQQLSLWDSAVKDATGTLGALYPDTYLIPSDQKPAQVASRLFSRFDEEIAANYAGKNKTTGLSWPEVITLASLVERESAKSDKSLVAGILMNRLKKRMFLQVDATLQYIEGTEGSWWPLAYTDTKKTDSPFNTYKHLGLPPEPIASPSLDSIEAVLAPQKTSCLYYLHDDYGKIHCATTYQGHLANVNRYLR